MEPWKMRTSTRHDGQGWIAELRFQLVAYDLTTYGFQLIYVQRESIILAGFTLFDPHVIVPASCDDMIMLARFLNPCEEEQPPEPSRFLWS